MIRLDSILAPKPLAIGGTGLLALLGGLATFMGFLDPSSLLTLAAGALAVSMLVLMTLLFLRWRLRKIYGQRDAGLMELMRGRPASVSDPDLVAKLDDFAKRFEEGCDKYVDATGMAISESPWYLLVGESGSGKTEAIRRCGVEFPEGLHEERQGAGGTTNMDWWFTEQAIILDTAGRFAVDPNRPRGAPVPSLEDDSDEEQDKSAASERELKARAATKAEWDQFLKSVVKARPYCPINGLLLVIPATSLLKDSADEVNAKAEELARFLGGVRTALTVRFPVTVLVTKSDLIPGFREFFGHLNDPNLAQQMLGWSKQGSLDDPFDPEEIDDYLDGLRGRLERRRLALIADPVHTQLPGARRIEQIDALYTFPQRFAELGPQLRRYLGKMFTKSKFNQNPLFLRGIYFTSSLEQGAAIDQVLAQLRGVSLKQLERQGIGFRRERPLFLRDVFMKKVFAESGLVTRETHTDRINRDRWLWTMGFAGAATTVFFAFAIIGWIAIVKNIRHAETTWAEVAKNHNGKPSQWSFAKINPRSELDVATVQWNSDSGAPGKLTIEAFLKQQFDKQSAIDVPVVFKPLEWLGLVSSPEALRQTTRDALIKTHLFNNVVVTAQQRLSTAEHLLNTRRVDELGAAGFRPDGAITQGVLQLKNLAKLDGTAAASIELDRLADAAIQSLAAETASKNTSISDSVRTWLKSVRDFRSTAKPDPDKAAIIVAQYWKHRLDDRAPERRLKPLAQLNAALNRWEAAHKGIASHVPPDTILPARVKNSSAQIRTLVAELKRSAEQADQAWAEIRKISPKIETADSMIGWLESTLQNDRTDAHEAIKLAKAVTSSPTVLAELDTCGKAIDASLGITASQPTVRLNLASLKSSMSEVATRGDPAPGLYYRKVTDLLELAAQPLGEAYSAKAGTNTLGAIIESLGKQEETIAANSRLSYRIDSKPADVQLARQLFVNVAAPDARSRAVRSWLESFESRKIGEIVREKTGTNLPSVPAVPLADEAPADRLAEFNPLIAGPIFLEVALVDKLVRAPATRPADASAGAHTTLDKQSLAAMFAPVASDAAIFAQQYLQFWSDRRPAPRRWDAWQGNDGLYAAMARTPTRDMVAKVNARADYCIEALKPLEDSGNAKASELIKSLYAVRINDSIAGVYNAWAGLPPVATDAATKLTYTDPKSTYQDLFAAIMQPDSFVRSLAIEAMRGMAADSKKVQIAVGQDLKLNVFDRFPFNPQLPPRREIPLNEMGRIKETLKNATRMAAPAAGAQDGAAVLLTLVAADTQIRDALQALIDSRSGVQQLLDAQRLAEMLTDPDVTCELTLTAHPQTVGIVSVDRAGARGNPVNVAAAMAQPFVVGAGGERLKFQVAAAGARELRANSDLRSNTWTLMEVLAQNKGQSAVWPADGKEEVSIEVVDAARIRQTLKFKVQFKKGKTPIEFRYPLPVPGK
jgi:hypothetical protein